MCADGRGRSCVSERAGLAPPAPGSPLRPVLLPVPLLRARRPARGVREPLRSRSEGAHLIPTEVPFSPRQSPLAGALLYSGLSERLRVATGPKKVKGRIAADLPLWWWFACACELRGPARVGLRLELCHGLAGRAALTTPGWGLAAARAWCCGAGRDGSETTAISRL